MTDIVTELLPALRRSRDLGFNVFDVMHHGVHEKQISNVFGWLLDSKGTHNLGDRFARIFIDEVNDVLARVDSEDAPKSFPYDDYLVSQEVNTAEPSQTADIADLALESNNAALVVENYYISDGHGHDYWKYLTYAQLKERRGAVVLLCEIEDRSRLKDGWENAIVVTYRKLIEPLVEDVDRYRSYRQKNPDAYSFIAQMDRKFVKRRGLVEQQEIVDFAVAMCDTGEAGRYGGIPLNDATKQFGEAVGELAKERFRESYDLLQHLKGRLKNYAEGPLLRQLEESLGPGFVRDVHARYSGVYQWTVNFFLVDTDPVLQIKFGPSAWHANESDDFFKHTVDPATADYSHLFITRLPTHEIQQSEVTLEEVLEGLDPTDRRLHDELLELHRSR